MATHSAEDVTTTALQAAAQQALAEGELSPEEMAPSRRGRLRTARRPRATRTKQQTVVKDEWSKTGRNEPCPCGSGKKYKMCHGR